MKIYSKTLFLIIIAMVVASTYSIGYCNQICYKYRTISGAVVIDPGHSRSRPGAISCTGNNEYSYNLKLVNHISHKLSEHGIQNRFAWDQHLGDISLPARVKNITEDDLFISVHHDSVQPQFIKYISSFPVSYKGKGYSIFVSRKNKFLDNSIYYAKKLAKLLQANGLRPSYHHGEQIKGESRTPIDKGLGVYYYDDLIVLKHANSPALLLEVGVIVNPDDEKLVNTNEFKDIIANSICRLISTN